MRRLIAAAMMVSVVTGCTAWRLAEALPQEAGSLRITMADGRRLVLRNAQVMGDSVEGFIAPSDRPSQRVRVALPAADVRRIEARKVDPSRTALAVIGLGVVAALVVALSNFQTTDPNH